MTALTKLHCHLVPTPSAHPCRLHQHERRHDNLLRARQLRRDSTKPRSDPQPLSGISVAARRGDHAWSHIPQLFAGRRRLCAPRAIGAARCQSFVAKGLVKEVGGEVAGASNAWTSAKVRALCGTSRRFRGVVVGPVEPTAGCCKRPTRPAPPALNPGRLTDEGGSSSATGRWERVPARRHAPALASSRRRTAPRRRRSTAR